MGANRDGSDQQDSSRVSIAVTRGFEEEDAMFFFGANLTARDDCGFMLMPSREWSP